MDYSAQGCVEAEDTQCLTRQTWRGFAATVCLQPTAEPAPDSIRGWPVLQINYFSFSAMAWMPALFKRCLADSSSVADANGPSRTRFQV